MAAILTSLRNTVIAGIILTIIMILMVTKFTDADFATETTVLAKHRILAQAATSMLAQANQSKQSVLTLLQ